MAGVETFGDAPGEPVAPGELTIPKAQELAHLLGSEALPYVRLVTCRRDGDRDVVVVDVEPDVPQRPVHDIRRVERIAVRFDPEDRFAPEPLGLRRDFPRVPHTFFLRESHPRHLCLYKERYEDQKPRWTSARFVRQLQSWLSRTARGELHEDGRALEPFFVGSRTPLVLPDRLYYNDASGLPLRLGITGVSDSTGRWSYIATEGEDRRSDGAHVPSVAIVVEGQPRTQSVLQLQPTNLAQLHEYLAEVGCDLLSELRAHLGAWRDSDPQSPGSDRELLGCSLIIIVRLPKRRTDAAPAEEVEVWAFATGHTLADVGAQLGMWDRNGDQVLTIIGGGDAQPEAIKLDLLNPMPALTRERAAAANGLAIADHRQVVAIGAGALGSQVTMNLVRSGYGRWTIVDEDRLLPHNLARHHLGGYAVGYSKAEILSQLANTFFTEEDIAQSIVADVLAPAGEGLKAAFANADVLLDMSASVAVARHLVHAVDSPARRISLFLNPGGTDLVLLAEDADRRVRLDDLEMQYYRELARRPELSEHLLSHGERIRYGHACRDVTATIPQDRVAVHAGIAAHAVRRATGSPDAALSIWRGADDLSITAVHAEPVAYERQSVGDWTLAIDPRLLEALADQRAAKLPNETGGVLVGTFDLQRKTVYVVDSIPSPPDSEEWPTLYIRGHAGLREKIERIDRVTGGGLQYVGEWHSHPAGASLQPSTDDRNVFAWLEEHMALDGLPSLMAIVGDRDRNWLFRAT